MTRFERNKNILLKHYLSTSNVTILLEVETLLGDRNFLTSCKYSSENKSHFLIEGSSGSLQQYDERPPIESICPDDASCMMQEKKHSDSQL